jgi:hypothetical protein
MQLLYRLFPDKCSWTCWWYVESLRGSVKRSILFKDPGTLWDQGPIGRPWLCPPIKELSNTELLFENWFFSAGSQQFWHTSSGSWQYQPTQGCWEDNCSTGRLHLAKSKCLEVPEGSLKPGRINVIPGAYCNRDTWHYPSLGRPWPGCLKGPGVAS